MPDYTSAVDMWSVGCIFAELYTREPILKGNTDLIHLTNIIKMVGSPAEAIWPGFEKLPGYEKHREHLAGSRRDNLKQHFSKSGFFFSFSLIATVEISKYASDFAYPLKTKKKVDGRRCD